MISNRFSINAFLISIVIFISNVSCFESENKTTFYDTNDKSFIRNLLRASLSKNFEVNINNNNNNYNQSLNHSFDENNKTLSEILLNKSSNANQSNPSLLLRQLFDEFNKSDSNSSVSESRTLSSWLGLDRLRRPALKLKPFQGSASTQYHQPVLPPLAPPQIPFPQFLSRPNFPGPHDPESLILPTSLFEESGIKYWLKFIENGGKFESPGSDEYEPRPIPSEEYPRKRRPHYSSKPIDIGEKPNDENEEYYEEDEENDDNNQNNNNNNNNHSEEEDIYEEPKSSGSTSSKSKQTYDTSPRCDKFTSDICVDDFEYPEQAIVDEIYKRRELFELMYSEVRDNNIPLVDGIPRDVEESYNYDYYYDNKDAQPSGSGYGAEKKSSPSKGSVCPSEVMYGKPKLARNKRGDWKVIVNAAEFTQTVRMEKCLKPNSKCNYISRPDFDSRCAQVHAYHRLLVFEKGKGFFIDTFRMPTACTCHVTRRVSYHKPSSSTHSPSNGYNKIKNKRPPPQLSNTLWSILGGPPS